MHDYFDILGVSHNAPAQEVRRAARRRVSRTHPDFAEPPRGGRTLRVAPPDLADVAVDFADMITIVERMQTAFFHSRDEAAH